MSGFEHTLAGLCDGISSIYATAASSYRVNGNINGHTALTVCAFCAPIRPMTAEHTPIRMRCSRLQKISLRINRHSPDSDGFAARIALLTGLGTGNSPLPRAKGDRALRLTYSDAETRPICLSIGIPLPLMYPLQAAQLGSYGCGRCPQPGDQRQNVGEHL